MLCPFCNNQVEESDIFCPYCGQRIDRRQEGNINNNVRRPAVKEEPKEKFKEEPLIEKTPEEIKAEKKKDDKLKIICSIAVAVPTVILLVLFLTMASNSFSHEKKSKPDVAIEEQSQEQPQEQIQEQPQEQMQEQPQEQSQEIVIKEEVPENVQDRMKHYTPSPLTQFVLRVGDTHVPSASVWCDSPMASVYSSDTSVIQVDSYGQVTAVGSGTAYVVYQAMGMMECYEYVVK